MPLDKFVLIVVVVLAAAGITVWVATTQAMAAFQVQGGELVFIPVALVGYIVWRVISERLSNKEDDRYDHIEK